MPAYFPHCTFNLNPRAASIDTPLHAFCPHRHVDHVHADAIIAIAAARQGERLTGEIFGGDLGWVPWQRPGFDLGLTVARLAADSPALAGLVMGSHGLITWGSTSRSCYETTLRMIQRAADWLDQHAKPEPFGPNVHAELPPDDRRRMLAAVAPVLRGLVSSRSPKVMHYVDTPDVLDFVGSRRAEEIARLGTTCPDHFLRTRVRPLFVPFAPATEDAAELVARLPALVEQYPAPSTPRTTSGADAKILLRCGIRTPWSCSFPASDCSRSRRTSRRRVLPPSSTRAPSGSSAGPKRSMRTCRSTSKRRSTSSTWSLEEAKLQRLPPARSLAGRVALVTGGAGGIGSAVARRLLEEGASVALVDIDETALAETSRALADVYGGDRVRAAAADVTSEAALTAAVAAAVREYGGLDILVANAGIASAAAIDETTLERWQQNLDVLATGYFLVAREAFRLMKQQGRGGSIVFVGSKNALVASAGASAYCSAKAAALHLARCLAVEGAEHGIRANVVNPDAVIRGSRIWDGRWRAERAASNRIDPDQVEEFYRTRSLLKKSVYPEDVAEAVYFFASDRSGKSTGNILNVDAGNITAFPR